MVIVWCDPRKSNSKSVMKRGHVFLCVNMSMAEILLLHYSRLFNDAALGVEVIYRQTKCEDSHS